MHTTQTLSDLSFRELQQTAKDLGLNAQGNRDEIIAKILEAQASPAPPDVTPEEPASEPEIVAEVPGEADIAPEVPEDAPPAPRAEPFRRVTLAPSAKKLLARLASSYLTAAGYSGAVEDSVVAAVESGKQPCIVKGSGNVKFAVKVFDQAFCRGAVAQDVPAGRGGVVMNLARRLADANQLPR